MSERPEAVSIGPLRAHRVLALAGLRVAPALTAGMLVALHTGRSGDGILVAAAVLLAAHVLDPRQCAAHLMPMAGLAARLLVPTVGVGLAYLVSLSLRPLPPEPLLLALVGSVIVLVAVATVVERFERTVEARVAVIGSAKITQSLAEELKLSGLPGYRIVGWVDRGSGEPAVERSRLGSLDEIVEIVHGERIDLLVNAPPDRQGSGDAADARPGASPLEVVESVAASCLHLDVRLIGLNQFYEEVVGHVPLATLNAAFFQYILHPRFRYSLPGAKRALDLVLTVVVAVLTAPLLAIAALAIKLGDGGPVLYRQQRVGAGGEPFAIVKLRTMRIDAEDGGTPRWSDADDERITPVGRVLRRTHLDEVPQLWNVLRGEMSLVGPRPERPELVAGLEWQIPFYDRRSLVKPGITGWAQIRCGYAGSHEGSAWKLCHDLYYLKHRSAALDAMIMLETVVTAVRDVRFPARQPDGTFVLDAVRSR